MLTTEQIELVHWSFERVVPVKELAARVFYTRLFTVRPALRDLFPIEMTVQGDKMMIALATVVLELRHPNRVVPYLQSLAHRHAEFGVKSEDFVHVGDALLWTLEELLGADFTQDTRTAWQTAYEQISKTMIAAMSSTSDAA